MRPRNPKRLNRDVLHILTTRKEAPGEDPNHTQRADDRRQIDDYTGLHRRDRENKPLTACDEVNGTLAHHIGTALLALTFTLTLVNVLVWLPFMPTARYLVA